MALYVIATPIGNADDISLRGLQWLKKAAIIILEERKESTRFLRQHGITSADKLYEQLNEHSSPEDIRRLSDLCAKHDVALITDCGTPGFADPGADLVFQCRQKKTPIHAIPGPSALMTLLSLSGERLSEFVFRGFLSAETLERQKQWRALQSEKRALILMDTPYRMQKTATEVQNFFPKRRLLWAADLTQDSEFIIETTGENLMRELEKHPAKAEFMLLLYPIK